MTRKMSIFMSLQFLMVTYTILLLKSEITSSSGLSTSSRESKCICPGFKRTVNTVWRYGLVVTYINFCLMSCNPGEAFKIQARSACGMYGNCTTQEWIKDISKEAKVWKKSNDLLTNLLKLSSGGAPPCVCPAVDRPICSVSPSGTLSSFSNVCDLKCRAYQNPTHVFAVSSCTRRNYNLPVPSSTAPNDREEVELTEWYKFMDSEMKFYQPIYNAMKGLFPDTETPCKP